MGRFVSFKNLPTLLDAMQELPDVRLTLIGSGPMEGRLRARAGLLGLGDRVEFRKPVAGEEKQRTFAEHDLLILPSVTEISPNVALEAVSAGLPVLLTEETGYRSEMSSLLLIKPLRTAKEIMAAVREVIRNYSYEEKVEKRRDWDTVAKDWVTFLSSL